MHDLRLDAVLGEQSLSDRQRPGRVHARAEGGVDGDAPVAELVAESLDDECAVIGQSAGRGTLLLEVGDEVVHRPGVEAGVSQVCPRGVGIARGAEELSDGAAEFDGAADGVAVPEGQLRRLTGRGGDPHAVWCDLLDPPRRGAECEDIAHARLVDHLFVEFADARGGADEIDGVEAAVRDRAAARHGETLGTRARGEFAGRAVPDDAWLEFSEVVAGVLAREHVEDGDVGVVRQVAIGRRAAYDVVELLDVPGVHGDHGDDLLGEHIEGVHRHGERLDGAGPHALDDNGRLQQIAAVLREDHAPTDRSHLVAGAAHALQSARDRGW